jgi:alanine dehydrogenase
MNIGVLREGNPVDRRVALTPPVVRQLAECGSTVWVETGAGNGAMFRDDEYIRAGAHIGYSPAEVIHRCELLVKISTPTLAELELLSSGTALMAFYHMAVAGPAVFETLIRRKITAIGCEIIRTERGRLPVLAPVSEIAGRMAVPLAANLLRSSSGGRGILLGGSPGVPPAHIVILGAGTVGAWAARTAVAAGARATVLDINAEKLRQVIEHVPNAATALADTDAVAVSIASADVVIGAVLVAGAKTPHVVTKRMVDSMRPGAAVIDVSIDQGGCIETSRPTTILDPTFQVNGVVHYCVPNLTADMGRSTSVAVAQGLMPYLLRMARDGVERTLCACPELAGGVYTYGGACVQPQLAAAFRMVHLELAAVMAAAQ